MKPDQIGSAASSVASNLARPKRKIWSPVSKSLRLQLIVAILLCAAVTLAVFAVVAHVAISVGNGIDEEVARADAVALALITHVSNPKDTEANSAYIQMLSDYYQVRIAVLAQDGSMVGRSANFTDDHVDLGRMRSILAGSYQGGPFHRLAPLQTSYGDYLILTIGQPQVKLVFTYLGDITLAMASASLAFFILFLMMIHSKLRYIEQLATGLRVLAEGELDLRVPEKGDDELALLAQSLNHMTAQLQQKIEAERRVELAKSELITNLSHDLRTPLTTIIGYLRLLMDGRYEDEQELKRFVGTTYKQAERLGSLTDSLFDYAVITSEIHELVRERVNLTELIAQLTEEWVPICAESQLELLCTVDPILLMAEVDPPKMVRALENILSNAVRYSHKPGVVRVSLQQVCTKALLTIENTCQPITKEDLTKMFDRFHRLDAARSSATGGSGLGLAIAKSIIEMHGGRVWAECEGEWIRFSIEIPIHFYNEVSR